MPSEYWTTRRTLLAGAATIAAGTAGCVDQVSRAITGYESLHAEFETTPECFERIQYTNDLDPNLRVMLSSECDADYVILYDSKGQAGIQEIGTGATQVVFDFDADSPEIYEAIAAVDGGTIEDRTHYDGTVLEKVSINAQYRYGGGNNVE